MSAAALPAVITAERTHPATAAQMRAQANQIIEVMKAVMVQDVHYGVVPGTKKPSLYKPGAEVLAVTFHIAPSYPIVEDLSGEDFIRYRVTCRGTHQGSGITIADGMGECSSLEEKFKWRKAPKPEYDAAPVDRRRIKYGEKRDGTTYSNFQVRAEHHDAANTVLKMAVKRAFIAMILNATAASERFTQDVEDLPDHLRHDDDAVEQTEEQKAEAEAAQKAITDRRERWAKAIEGCTTAEETAAAWAKGVAEFKEAEDREGADAFREQVKARNLAIKGGAPKAVEQQAGAPAAESAGGEPQERQEEPGAAG